MEEKDLHYEDHKIMYEAINDRSLSNMKWIVGIVMMVTLPALGYFWNKNTELEHRLTTLEVGHNKVEKVIEGHIGDPKLHHNIKELLSTLEKELAVLTDRVKEIGDDLDDHEGHPKLHENILVEVKVLEEKILELKKQLNEIK